jgi:sugar diacid utilization regulator
MDFIVTRVNGVSGYLSTNNHNHPVYGYCKNSKLEDCFQTLKEYYPNCTYATDHSWTNNDPNLRAFTDTDKIHLNKLRYRLQKESALKLERQPER